MAGGVVAIGCEAVVAMAGAVGGVAIAGVAGGVVAMGCEAVGVVVVVIVAMVAVAIAGVAGGVVAIGPVPRWAVVC